jgi:hypothetical protein
MDAIAAAAWYVILIARSEEGEMTEDADGD